MNDDPIRFVLKPEDSAPDPQATGIELMRLLSGAADDALHLRDLITRWADDPIAVQRRAQARAVELHETTARALERGESLLRALRQARLFSAAYSTDVGVNDGR